MIVGIVGGGQLARMMALAGYPLGLRFVVLDPARDACAGQVAAQILGEYDDVEALAELARRCDVITFDFENVPAVALERLSAEVPVAPNPQALASAQDRLSEKTLFRELGIGTPAFAAVDSLQQLEAAVEAIGLPAVLKTRRFGYDGKGQRVLRERAELAAAWDELGKYPLILEGFVDFTREVSIIAVRGRDGAIAFYPLTENRHEGGILRLSRAPCTDAAALDAQAQRHARALLEHLDYVGVLAIEFFDVGGTLIANEMAPRVHNSGHWTIEGAETSQFENHLRAVCGMSLGATQARGCSAMLNFIGRLPAPAAFLAEPGLHWHDYGKEARGGRKVGHATLRADEPQTLAAALSRLQPLVVAD
ncbi:5-(carboxyamino)imidazole ribonucleotide synthase [Plasticicumulans acidivorans]|uniref:N5-carboxyaminoimidazole ribonucleotide synthase n=1 Tax=Plasticicumulans acidivorans TaxID=886464 RepID=A0A317MW06_9GAMM|nr:5-(carboxyamino)imidazole ribonucleotide synthase [Plasticicumulans acidivorans]